MTGSFEKRLKLRIYDLYMEVQVVDFSCIVW